MLADFPDLTGHEVYACGSVKMVEAAVPAFLAQGLGEGFCFSDAFVPSAPRQAQSPFALSLSKGPPQHSAGLRQAQPERGLCVTPPAATQRADGIQRVLQHQPELGVAFHHQRALEEHAVGSSSPRSRRR